VAADCDDRQYGDQADDDERHLPAAPGLNRLRAGALDLSASAMIAELWAFLAVLLRRLPAA
jgi:hypothetical protein